MAFRDFRQFLKKLEDVGELKHIKAEVDWNDEVAAIAEEGLARKAPAFIFENIKDYKNTQGRKIAINCLASWKRMAIALDMPTASPKEMLVEYRKRIKNPVRPVLLATGPCKEVIHKGDDVNIYDFPIMMLSPKDGGRYTRWQLCITKDPETGWVNVGTYNSMLFGEKDAVTTSPVRTQHMSVHARKYQAMGKKMPYAIAIGCEPVTGIVGCAPFKVGVNEFDMAGALRGEPVELVKCETIDLEVPATAEIVIEGEIDLDPQTYRPEGPGGRYSGYYASITKKNLAPVLKIKCITHRKDPVYWSYITGRDAHVAPTGPGCAINLQTSALIWDQLEEVGIEGITGVWSDTSAMWTTLFISMDVKHYGDPKVVAAQIWGNPKYSMMGKFIVVVDSDIDIFDLGQINHAIANRVRGREDIIIYKDTIGSPIEPGVAPDIVQKLNIGKWDRVLIDATWPYEWEPREEWGGQKYPFKTLSDPSMRERARSRWKELGLE